MNKRQQSPVAGTPCKKTKGSYNPRDEAKAPVRNPHFKTKTPAKVDNTAANEPTSSDSDSEARDKAYLEGVKAQEINFEFELALDEDNIKEALAMATTDEQRERAKKAAEYIEQVRLLSIRTQLPVLTRSTTHLLQVRSRRNCLTDPKNRPVVSFFNQTPRIRAAAKAATNYSAQVSKTTDISSQYLPLKQLRKLILPFLLLQLKVARAISNEMDQNNNSEGLKKAALAGAAESAKATKKTGFAKPG